MLLKAALNGARRPGEHPALPLTLEALAIEAQQAVAAGASALHVHALNRQGLESLAPDDVAETIRAIRTVCPHVPLGLSTGAWIVPDPARRLELIRRWEVLPDFAGVNLHEEGALDVAAALLDKGVGVEAGLWNMGAVELLAKTGLAANCLRLLLEPRQNDLAEALATAKALEAALDQHSISEPRLLHGFGAATWGILHHAVERGYDTRIGLEDTLTLPDGLLAPDNVALVTAAVEVLASYRREVM